MKATHCSKFSSKMSGELGHSWVSFLMAALLHSCTLPNPEYKSYADSENP